MTTNGRLERITANLTPRTSAALKLTVEVTGDSKTDTLNRAIQVYAYLMDLTAKGGLVFVQEDKGELQRLMMI